MTEPALDCKYCNLVDLRCSHAAVGGSNRFGPCVRCEHFDSGAQQTKNKYFITKTFFEETGCPMSVRWDSKLELDIKKDVYYGVLLRDPEEQLLATLASCKCSSWREHFHNKSILDHLGYEHKFPFEDPLIFSWAQAKFNFSENFTHFIITLSVPEPC